MLLDMVRGFQIRGARAVLGWGVRDLAEKSDVTIKTISRIENGSDARMSTVDRLQRALEAAGIIFIDADDQAGPGVRLKK